jgi:signal transduction histidine kinase/RimJ/RimL family protein N-acetyltransferase
VPPDPPLADEVVLLRPPVEADAPAIAAACADPEIASWVPVPVPYTLADARAFIEGVADGWSGGAHQTFAIVERASGALVGMIGLDRGSVPGRASVGYWLAPDARGRGLATRAVRLVVGWAQQDPGLERLELTTLLGNDASGRVALRAGFQREGILRRYLRFRGRTVDVVMYALCPAGTGADGSDDAGVGPPDGATGAPTAGDPLGRVPLFAKLAPSELARVRSVATEVTLPAGGLLMAEGDPGDALYLLLEGELAVTKHLGGAEVGLARVGPGAVQGEIAVLEGGVRRATVRALVPSRLLRLGRDDLFDVLAREPGVLRSLVATVAGRLRGMEATLQEQDRLASLGTLAAGLAHELNNPAAAASSSVGRLAGALDDWDRATAALGALGAAGGPVAAPLAAELLDSLRDEVTRRAADPPLLDPLDAADRRDAVRILLAGLGMADADEPAAALVALGWDGNLLDDLLAPFAADEARLVVAAWLAAAALVRQLLTEVGMAAGRIAEIVGAVREYTYLDRAPLGRIDVTAGIENTLVILRSRWRAGITIERTYAPGLPSIEAYGSELNQVWTNLLANAIDAMGGRGTISIGVRPTPAGGVEVETCDSGPGIPAEIRGRIFDPFYTTKEVGTGTGLGLHISRSIVARHGGDLELVAAEPGRTCFRVTLPARPPDAPAAAAAGGAPGADARR